jgi:protein-tyrosine phosphatase
MAFKNILVVCVGNICRSPMAEYFLKTNCPNQHIESAGLSAMVGHHADEKAIHCMDQFHIDMRPHIAKQINASLIKQADLILVMSTNQAQHIDKKDNRFDLFESGSMTFYVCLEHHYTIEI